MECITHHICDCQQAELDRLRAENEDLLLGDPDPSGNAQHYRVMRKERDRLKEKLKVAEDALYWCALPCAHMDDLKDLLEEQREMALQALKTIRGGE